MLEFRWFTFPINPESCADRYYSLWTMISVELCAPSGIEVSAKVFTNSNSYKFHQKIPIPLSLTQNHSIQIVTKNQQNIKKIAGLLIMLAEITLKNVLPKQKDFI